ncbi:energy-coupling factor transporter transmembrane component T family protein [Alloscardovia sp. HMSC034E08]|uniref:energy-coupling factor transporter transmembrane component T family protein n=1 Tax=Alloscardovia sp. HMSC034E08 TaxID=1739413 RepID=UPI0008D75354|nr:energy-coupling factor transporter transmembrane component T [Alloscardovia sp. HMSC034E08]OFQ99947.1 hypothetical protein HMPREF2909_05525 [Alloscardovia sp. HMSC034E08]
MPAISMRCAILERINPSVKMIATIISALLLSTHTNISLHIGYFVTSVLLLIFTSHARLRRIIITSIPAAIAASGMFLTGYFYSAHSNGLTSGLILSSRILSFAGLGLVFALTITPEKFIYSLRDNLHIPTAYSYSILAAFNLAPLIKRDYKQVKLAMRARGIRMSKLSLKPLVPMLVHSMRTSELLAEAMQSKGFDEDASRSRYTIIHVHAYDFIYAVFMIAPAIMAYFF